MSESPSTSMYDESPSTSSSTWWATAAGSSSSSSSSSSSPTSEQSMMMEEHHQQQQQQSTRYIAHPRDFSKAEWANMIGPATDIQNRMVNYMITHHRACIQDMCAENKSSIVISYVKLAEEEADIATLLIDGAAQQVLRIFAKALHQATTTTTTMTYRTTMAKDYSVRITELPLAESVDNLIRVVRTNCLARVICTVTRISIGGGGPEFVTKVTLRCQRCRINVGPYVYYARPIATGCPKCGRLLLLLRKTKKKHDDDDDHVVLVEYGELTLQDASSNTKRKAVPRTIRGILLGDDLVRTGENQLVGRTMSFTGFLARVNELVDGDMCPYYDTAFVINNVESYERVGGRLALLIAPSAAAGSDYLDLIRRLKDDGRIFARLVASIAPSIRGFDRVKRAMVLCLVSGVAKKKGTLRIRGDAHLLLCGDIAVGKTQLLKAAQRVSPLAVYTTGQGSSGVGLTASVRRAQGQKHWSLDSGALAIADNGLCIIDDIHLIKNNDAGSIHEAMEQQTISIAKCGFVTKLDSRCTVMAACVPVHNFYDREKPLTYNVKLKTPLLSRFDVVCVMYSTLKDDTEVAQAVVRNHIRGHPASNYRNDDDDDDAEEDLIPRELFELYIAHAKRLEPRMDNIDPDTIPSVYAKLREETTSAHHNHLTHKVSARTVETLIRLAEACAKVHLEEHQVTEAHVSMALKVFLENFIETQFYAMQQRLRKVFANLLSFEL